MKYKIAAVLTCLILVSCLLPVTALAYTYDGAPYDDDEYNQLRTFLETEYAGVKNGDRVSATYDPDNPTTWNVGWSGYTVTTPNRVAVLDWTNKGVVGELDLSGFDLLIYVYLNNNDLTGINLTGDTELRALYMSGNNISGIDLSDNSLLDILDCDNNPNITELDISTCPNLYDLSCSGCGLTALDLSSNPAITTLACDHNRISSLTFYRSAGENSSLKYIYCQDNALTSLDASGIINPTYIFGGDLDCSGQTDSGGNPCFTSLTLTGSKFYNLYCNDNLMHTFDLRGCLISNTFECKDSHMETLITETSVNMEDIIISGNNLTSLDDLIDNLHLYIFSLDCSNNDITSLDLSGCHTLMYLNCEGNPLTFIDTYVEGCYDIALTAGDGGYVELFIDYGEGDLIGTAVPGANAAFINWTDDNDGDAEVAVTAIYSMSAGEVYDLTAHFLYITGSPSNGHIFTGGRITLTPSIEGGEWGYNGSYLSREGNQFTGLRAGTTTIAYTVGGVSVLFDVTIEESGLPQTGQDFTIAWIITALAALTLAVGAVLLIKRKASI